MSFYHREQGASITPEAERFARTVMPVFGVSAYALQLELGLVKMQLDRVLPAFGTEVAEETREVVGQVETMLGRFMGHFQRQTQDGITPQGMTQRVSHQVAEGIDGDILAIREDDLVVDERKTPLSDAEFIFAAGSALEERVWQEYSAAVMMGLQIPPLLDQPLFVDGPAIIPAFADHLKTLAGSMRAFAEQGKIPATVPFRGHNGQLGGQYEAIHFQREAAAIRDRNTAVA